MSRSPQTAAGIDRAIDALLQGPAGPRPADEGELMATARLLRENLPRLHPGFGFAELLSARLAAAGRSVVDTAELPLPTPLHPQLASVGAEASAASTEPSPSEGRRLGLVAGGAIASGVSIAGAALVVWHRSRSSGGIW